MTNQAFFQQVCLNLALKSKAWLKWIFPSSLVDKANDQKSEEQGSGIEHIPRTGDETELESSRDFVTAHGFHSKIVK